MSKILNSTVLGATTPKIVELLDEMVINGQVYDKSTLVPKPLKFMYAEGLASGDIYLNTQYYNTSHMTKQYTKNTIIADDKNANICYIIMNNATSTSILKVAYENDERVVKATIYSEKTSANSYNLEFISQDDSYVYVLLNPGGTAVSPHVGRINKNSNAIEWTSFAITAGRAEFLFENGAFLFFVISGEKNAFTITKYNKITKATTNVYSDNGTGVTSTANFRTIPSKFRLDKSFYAVRHDESFSGTKQLIIKKYVYNEATDTFASVQVGLNLSILPKRTIPSYEVNQVKMQYTLYEFNNNSSDEYMVLDACRYEGKFYLFRKNSDTSFELIQQYSCKSSYNSIIPLNNNKTLMALSNNIVYFYNFNEADEKFELTSEINKAYTRLGIDMNQNIWIEMNNGEVEAISNSMPVKTEALFQEDSYEYNNEDITATLNVYASDFKSGLVSSQLQLQIIGPAYFSATNEKTMIINTSEFNVVQTPVIITGAGFVKVITTVI